MEDKKTPDGSTPLTLEDKKKIRLTKIRFISGDRVFRPGDVLELGTGVANEYLRRGVAELADKKDEVTSVPVSTPGGVTEPGKKPEDRIPPKVREAQETHKRTRRQRAQEKSERKGR